MNNYDIPAWMWKDPADVAERLEQQSCHGCAWIERLSIAGERIESCAKGRAIGKKCKQYRENK